MKVVFKTNLDNYKTNCFPKDLSQVPRVGEKVMVNEVFIKYFNDKNLPIRLEVVDVIWTEIGVICELWYNALDKKIAEVNGAKLL